MDILNLINDIQAADPEFSDRISPRRAAIKNITSFGSKVAVAALPFAFSTLFKKAYGQSATPSVNEVLNFALTAELTEAAFYNTAVARNIIPATDTAAIGLIRTDENNHVTFIRNVLGTANISAANARRNTTAIAGVANFNEFFDFSGGAKGTTPGTGPFATVFTSYPAFLALAQAFEDTGVRAYKGQAGFLKGNQTVLTAALNIHSIEARHAAYIRRLRVLRSSAPADFRPWVTLDGATASGFGNLGLPSAGVTVAASIYENEANVTHAGANVSALPNVNNNVRASTEAFDEPLTSTQVVNNILSNFLRTN